MTFEQCVKEAWNTPDLVEQYKRLTGARLGGGLPIERMIDDASGFKEKEYTDFFNFVRDYIWIPVLLKKIP